MNPVVIFLGMVASLMGGYYLGFDWGRKCGLSRPVSRSEAASILAKASWAKRDRVQVPLPAGFFRSVNR